MLRGGMAANLEVREVLREISKAIAYPREMSLVCTNVQEKIGGRNKGEICPDRR